jgi:hypothetical protein
MFCNQLPECAIDLVSCVPAGGDDGFEYWWDRLAEVTGQYSRVLMLGDSMGATAALMFSPLATAVQAFAPQACPQLRRANPADVS